MILYFNKMLEFAYGVSSAINFDNPHLMHKTKSIFFNKAVTSVIWKNVQTWWVILYVILKQDLFIVFLLWTLATISF